MNKNRYRKKYQKPHLVNRDAKLANIRPVINFKPNEGLEILDSSQPLNPVWLRPHGKEEIRAAVHMLRQHNYLIKESTLTGFEVERNIRSKP